MMRKQKRSFWTGFVAAVLVFVVSFSLGSVFALGNDLQRAFAVEPLFTVSGSTSSVQTDYTYNAKDHESSSVVDALGNAVVGKGSVSGVKVSLAQGDEFRYTKVIDLTGKTKNDLLFEFAITPETIGVKEVDAFEVILTDAYDATNYITIHVDAAPDTHPADYYRGPGLINGVGYLRAGFDGELVAKDWFYNALRKDEGSGAICFLDFAGIGGESQPYMTWLDEISMNVMSIYYEDSTKSLYMDDKQEYWSKKNAVVDLDDESYFSTPWGGFKTGECFLTIKGLKYQKSSFNFVLTKIDGENVADVSSERKPHIINVNTFGYAEDELPTAVVGEPYPVFPAESISPYYGALPVNTAVYYGDENGEKLTITDNKFHCAKEGEYTIVYTVDDGHGTTVKKTISITAEAGAAGIIVAIDDVAAEGFVAGDRIILPDATWEGPIGKGTLTKSVLYNGNTIALDGASFLMPAAGEYEFIYTVTDLAGRMGTSSFKISVEKGTLAQFTEEIAVPKYFISGRTYVLPTGYAYNYTDGSGDKIKAKIYYTDENGEKLLPAGKVTPTQNSAGSNVKVVYDATLNGNHSQKEYSIPVIDIRNSDGAIDCQKLFYVVEGDAEVTVNETSVTMKTYEDAIIDWVNPLATNGFTLSFCGDKRFVSFSSVAFLLSDVDDPTIAVKFNYLVENGKTYFRVNENGKKYELTEDLYSSDLITLSYKANDNTVAFSSNVKINAAIAETVNGATFDGFPSGKIMARIIIDGVGSGAKISVSQISNQMLGDLSCGEFANPIFGCVEDYGGTKKYGETVKLPKPYVVDAIDPGLSFTVNVYAPNGDPVTATDGTILQGADGDKEYEIVLSEYGSYKVYYTATDLSGNSGGLSYILEVNNDVAPKITLTGTLPTSVKVGEKVVLPKASATDDVDESVEVRIYIVTEQGQIVSIKNGAFIFKNAGEYKVYYRCCDSAGNMTCIDYTISVQE